MSSAGRDCSLHHGRSSCWKFSNAPIVAIIFVIDYFAALSRWAIVHRKAHAELVSSWRDQFFKGTIYTFALLEFGPVFSVITLLIAAPGRKLAFLYLASDIMQRSRSQGTEFLSSFSGCVAEAISHAFETRAAPLERVKRMLDVWHDRHVFSTSYTNAIRQRVGLPQLEEGAAASGASVVTPKAPDHPPYMVNPVDLSGDLASLLPQLSHSLAGPNGSNSTFSHSNALGGPDFPLIVGKIFKSALPLLSSIEDASLELEMLRDRVDMVRPDLASGAELAAKIGSQSNREFRILCWMAHCFRADVGEDAALLLDELDDDLSHVNKFKDTLQAEVGRRNALIAALTAVVTEQESLVAALSAEVVSVASLATSATNTLESFKNRGSKRGRPQATDQEVSEEPPPKFAKTGDETAQDSAGAD